MDRVFICDLWMITGDEKWIAYDSNVRKRSWSKPGEASQTVLQSPYWRQGRWRWVFGGIGKELFMMSCSYLANHYFDSLVSTTNAIEAGD